jgi:hypothetical protein
MKIFIIVYLILTMLQLCWFAVVGAGISTSEDSNFGKDLLAALIWPIYWLRVLFHD